MSAFSELVIMLILPEYLMQELLGRVGIPDNFRPIQASRGGNSCDSGRFAQFPKVAIAPPITTKLTCPNFQNQHRQLGIIYSMIKE